MKRGFTLTIVALLGALVAVSAWQCSDCSDDACKEENIVHVKPVSTLPIPTADNQPDLVAAGIPLDVAGWCPSSNLVSSRPGAVFAQWQPDGGICILVIVAHPFGCKDKGLTSKVRVRCDCGPCGYDVYQEDVKATEQYSDDQGVVFAFKYCRSGPPKALCPCGVHFQVDVALSNDVHLTTSGKVDDRAFCVILDRDECDTACQPPVVTSDSCKNGKVPERVSTPPSDRVACGWNIFVKETMYCPKDYFCCLVFKTEGGVTTKGCCCKYGDQYCDVVNPDQGRCLGKDGWSL